jgi:hypothetical protein
MVFLWFSNDTWWSNRSRFLRRHLRAVKLGGFQNDWLNVLFVERLAPQFRVNQRAVTRKPPVMAGFCCCFFSPELGLSTKPEIFLQRL